MMMTDDALLPSPKDFRPTRAMTGLIWTQSWLFGLREAIECERREKGALPSLHALRLGWGHGPDLGGASRTLGIRMG